MKPGPFREPKLLMAMECPKCKKGFYSNRMILIFSLFVTGAGTRSGILHGSILEKWGRSINVLVSCHTLCVVFFTRCLVSPFWFFFEYLAFKGFFHFMKKHHVFFGKF